MKALIRILLLVTLILMVSCTKAIPQAAPSTNPNPSGQTEAGGPNLGTASPGNNQKILTYNLYFPDQQAEYLVKVPTQVTVVDEAVVKAIIEALQKGNPSYGKVIPAEAKLLKASVNNGIVNLDFSKEFRDKHWGGSTGEQMTIYSIVNSLTELPNIKGVQFYLEGQIQGEMMGHFDWSKPFLRNERLIKQ